MRKGVQGPLARSGNTPPPVLDYVPPPDSGLSIVHSDADILIVSKPAGLLSVPGNRPELADCMEARVQKLYPEATIVHRLDRGTSGLMLMARNSRAHRIIGKQFENRKTAKTYIAVVYGKIDQDNGTINEPLRTDWYNRPKQMVDPCLGREAVTKWEVLGRTEETTRLALHPVTGRSHQLRVHMQFMGNPILGDEFYASQKAYTLADRLLLHAEMLEINHPSGGERIGFRDPCPF